jgi:molecular chaperone DnaK
MNASMKLGEAIYKQSGEQASGEAEGASESSANNGEKVVDAEYEEVKNDDKKS